MKLLVLALAACSTKTAPATGWDVAAYGTRADATAHAWHPDAELVLLDADATDAHGISHLETAGARLKFEYRSQVDLAKTAAEHVGVSAGRPPNCLLSIYIHDKRTQFSTGLRTGDCAGPALGPIKCTVTQVWQRAIAKGAPAGVLANIEMHLSNNARRWRFVTTDRAIDLNFDDDC